jgi:hypothetical protein
LNHSSHIIEKVFLEVNTLSIETAEKIKNNIDLFLKTELFPRLEILFEEYNPGDEIIRFDEMNMNLTLERWDNFEELKFKISNQFIDKLKVDIQSIPTFKHSNPRNIDSSKKEIYRTSYQSDSGDILLFFLENGYLPWYGSEEKIVDLMQEENWSLLLDNPAFFKTLKSLISSNGNPIDRFIFQFPDESIIAFLSRINQLINNSSKSILTICKKLSLENHRLFLKLLFQISFEENTGLEITSKTLILQLKNSISDENIDSQIFNNIKNLLKTVLPSTIVRKNGLFDDFLIQDIQPSTFKDSIVSNQLKKGNEKVLEEIDEGQPVENAQKISSNKDSGIKRETLSDQDISEISNKIEINKRILSNEKLNSNIAEKKEEFSFFKKGLTEIAVQNAGLILLHPFLKQFFLTTKIINERNEIAISRQDLAVQTLHYLATGNENIFETNLVFEKFLCGIPLQIPVQKESLLNYTIKAEAITLLSEVIKNWPVLKNTSPDGLRQMFIQREGKLIQKEDKNFKLIVEQKAQDVLLERLNWNISIIKLPWLKELVFIEW